MSVVDARHHACAYVSDSLLSLARVLGSLMHYIQFSKYITRSVSDCTSNARVVVHRNFGMKLLIIYCAQNINNSKNSLQLSCAYENVSILMIFIYFHFLRCTASNKMSYQCHQPRLWTIHEDRNVVRCLVFHMILDIYHLKHSKLIYVKTNNASLSLRFPVSIIFWLHMTVYCMWRENSWKTWERICVRSLIWYGIYSLILVQWWLELCFIIKSSFKKVSLHSISELHVCFWLSVCVWRNTLMLLFMFFFCLSKLRLLSSSDCAVVHRPNKPPLTSQLFCFAWFLLFSFLMYTHFVRLLFLFLLWLLQPFIVSQFSSYVFFLLWKQR